MSRPASRTIRPSDDPSLVPVHGDGDILPAYRDTPVGDLLRFQNLNAPLRSAGRPRLVIGACIDHRLVLRIPRGFSYVIRSAGARLDGFDFQFAFAAGVGKVVAAAVIGHDDCGMVGIGDHRDTFIDTLTHRVGWQAEEAAAMFDEQAPRHAIDDVVPFVRQQAGRLRERFPRLLVAPLYYTVREGRLLQVRE